MRKHAARLLVVVLGAAALAGGVSCGSDEDEPVDTPAQIANPASVYCEELGGTIEIVDEDSGQVGYCTLPNGDRIEEWELYDCDHTTEP